MVLFEKMNGSLFLNEDARPYLLSEGEIIFARTGATVGKTYLYKTAHGRCAFAGYLIRFIPDREKLDATFLFYYTHSYNYWRWLRSFQTEGVQPNVNAEQYSQLPVILPPVLQQQKIISILSNVDYQIQKQQEYKSRLETLKKGINADTSHGTDKGEGLNFKVGKGDEVTESELPALEQLVAMGYEYKSQADLNKERRDYRQVLLNKRIEDALRRLNPELDEDGIHDALGQILEDSYPYTLDPVDTNEKIRAKLVELSRSGGLEPIVVTQNLGNGPEQKVARIIDFERPENNDFLVTNQFQLEGFKNPIFPDIVVFVNGIPLVIMECKSPAIPDPIGEAVERKNFRRYQARGQGYERLFFYNHCLIAACGTLARHGTLESNVNFFAKWSDPYPMTKDDVRKLNGRAREQEILIAGLLSKRSLLDNLQNFVIYETMNSKRVKKTAKHQQYRVVTKSVSRLRLGEDIADRGGVVWHTQGSGKSFSMLWLATQLMYRFGNPPILVITDRKQLDKQIHETFKSCGFPDPVRARSGRHLAELLANPKGRTIMTIIDKFATETPYTEEKIIALVDEAHRSQFKVNAEYMRAAMPNAVFFAFTGTPIDKKGRSDYRVFGPLLDKYGFKESQADGATLPIRYEGRLPELFVEGGDTIDQIFDRVFSGLDQDMKTRLKKQYVTKGRIAEVPSRIKRIALDLVDHYHTHVEPNGYKAMLVAPSREAAVTYKQELDFLGAPPSKIIMTSNLGEAGEDGKSWDEYYLSPEQRERGSRKIQGFKRSNQDPDCRGHAACRI